MSIQSERALMKRVQCPPVAGLGLGADLLNRRYDHDGKERGNHRVFDTGYAGFIVQKEQTITCCWLPWKTHDEIRSGTGGPRYGYRHGAIRRGDCNPAHEAGRHRGRSTGMRGRSGSDPMNARHRRQPGRKPMVMSIVRTAVAAGTIGSAAIFCSVPVWGAGSPFLRRGSHGSLGPEGWVSGWRWRSRRGWRLRRWRWPRRGWRLRHRGRWLPRRRRRLWRRRLRRWRRRAGGGGFGGARRRPTLRQCPAAARVSDCAAAARVSAGPAAARASACAAAARATSCAVAARASWRQGGPRFVTRGGRRIAVAPAHVRPGHRVVVRHGQGTSLALARPVVALLRLHHDRPAVLYGLYLRRLLSPLDFDARRLALREVLSLVGRFSSP